jgi:hypothetical protein
MQIPHYVVYVAAAKAGMPGTVRRKALGDITNNRSGKGPKEEARKDVGAGEKQKLKYFEPLAAPATLVTFPSFPTPS